MEHKTVLALLLILILKRRPSHICIVFVLMQLRVESGEVIFKIPLNVLFLVFSFQLFKILLFAGLHLLVTLVDWLFVLFSDEIHTIFALL